MLTVAQLKEIGLTYHEDPERYYANVAAVAGAIRLDRWDSQWHEKIDLKKLTQTDSAVGILEQIFGILDNGSEQLGLRARYLLKEFGFILPDNTHISMLWAAWKHEILRRKN